MSTDNRHTRKKGNRNGKDGKLKDAKTGNLGKNEGGGVLVEDGGGGLVGDGGDGHVPQQKEDFSVQPPVRGMICYDSQDLYQSKCIFRL